MSRTKATTDMQKANEARVAHGLPEVEVGFDYAETIQRICKLGRWENGKGKEKRYKIPDVAACLGITPQAVHKILDGDTTDLKHITAQLLVGLWKDVFEDYSLRTLPMTQQQRSSQVVRKPKPQLRKHRIE